MIGRSSLRKRGVHVSEKRSLLVWKNYALLKSQSKIIRSGFGLLGVYPYAVNNPVEPQRSESVLEHVAGTLILVNLISAYYPEAIPRTELLAYILLLLHHETGEGKIGDLPDDGRRDEAEKNRIELEALKAYSQTLPPDLGQDLVIDFMEFQSKISQRGQVTYCIDKIEAVFQGLLYEMEGRGGDMQNKAKAWKVSEQDQKYMVQTGTTRLVDNWAAHFLDKIKDLPCAPLFIEILRSAVEDVRGEWFDWL